jgi:FAD/FMN-containing dehydrogenase
MTWQNWAGTATADPARRYWPRSADEIADAVRAAAAAGLTVRALGSGHSFTPAAATSGAALDLSGWTGIVSADLASGFVTVRSGTTLRELNALLDTVGLAMPNLGDIDAQTISGAISTGTHGTGAGLGGLATQVAALDLVLADGSVVSCSAQDRPDLFAAALVSVGALGVLSTVTLRCVPAFTLAADERPMPLDEVLDRFDEFAAANDHFEFYLFPYSGNALVKRNNAIAAGDGLALRRDPLDSLSAWGAAHFPHRGLQPPIPPGPHPPWPPPMPAWRRFFEYEVMENAAFGAVCRTGRAVPRLIRPLNRLAAATVSKRSYSAPSHQVFVTPRRVRFVESEYAVPREALLDVLADLRAGVRHLPDPVMFPVEVRVAAADDIWLSTAYGRDTAYVAIHQYVGLPYLGYFRLFESIATAVGGRPHWGKLHTRDAAYLAAAYPRFADFLRVRDETDPERRFINPYLDQIFGL